MASSETAGEALGVSDPSAIIAMAQDVTTTAAVLVGGGWAY
jgi:hypothetical protein